MTDLLTYWPIIVAIATLAAGLGAALVKISDLKQRVTDLETARARDGERVTAKLDELGRGLSRIEGMLTAREQRAP
jgi:CHASE1-domain containing sensor protein